MKSVTAREASQEFSKLLSKIEHGEKVVITKHGRPVAVLSPYQAPAVSRARKAAIDRAIRLMEAGLPWGKAFRVFTRDEMHDR
jgi:prevent-host-death family protein